MSHFKAKMHQSDPRILYSWISTFQGLTSKGTGEAKVRRGRGGEAKGREVTAGEGRKGREGEEGEWGTGPAGRHMPGAPTGKRRAYVRSRQCVMRNEPFTGRYDCVTTICCDRFCEN